MACNPDFVQYIIDQCCDAGEIAVKKMMGDWCAYCDGVLFGLICDNNFYIKVTEPGRALLKEVILRPPYDGAKDYFYISDVDDREYLASLVKATIPALPNPKVKKNPMKRCQANEPAANFEVVFHRVCPELVPLSPGGAPGIVVPLPRVNHLRT